MLADDEKPMFDGTDRLRLVFVDGVFAPDLSDDAAMEGVEIRPLAEVLATDITWARELFGVLEGRGQEPVDRPLASLNTARATEGVAIRVTGRAPRPISLVYRRSAPGADALVHHLVRLEPGADLTLLESGPAAARLNSVTEVEVADGAAFHHVRTQGRDHERRAATALFARLGRGSRLKSFTLTVNGRLTRNDHVVEFAGDEAVAHVAGACVGDGDFHHDDTVFVTHDALACESRQVFKKVLRAGATGVFQGKILVKPGAQKTDGYQISQGLAPRRDEPVPRQAGARDLCRRRGVQPRLDGGGGGRGRALLPDVARDPATVGGGAPGARLPRPGHRRGGGRGPGRGVARAAGGLARAPAAVRRVASPRRRAGWSTRSPGPGAIRAA